MVSLAHGRFALVYTVLSLGHELDVFLHLVDILEPDRDAKLTHNVPCQVFVKAEAFSQEVHDHFLVLRVQGLADHGGCPLGDEVKVPSALDLRLIAANGHVLLHAEGLHFLNLIVHELCLLVFCRVDNGSLGGSLFILFQLLLYILQDRLFNNLSLIIDLPEKHACQWVDIKVYLKDVLEFEHESDELLCLE